MKGGDAMQKKKTVCFTGHRSIIAPHAMTLSAVLENEIVRQIKGGATVFRAGGAIGFDTVAALKVLELKEQYPSIRLELILPCKDQTRGWNELCIRTYKYCLDHADSVSYVSESYYNGCMLERNRRLVDGADVCIAYCTQSHGGTYYTCKYALKRSVELVNIADRFE